MPQTQLISHQSLRAVVSCSITDPFMWGSWQNGSETGFYPRTQVSQCSRTLELAVLF